VNDSRQTPSPFRTVEEKDDALVRQFWLETYGWEPMEGDADDVRQIRRLILAVRLDERERMGQGLVAQNTQVTVAPQSAEWTEDHHNAQAWLVNNVGREHALSPSAVSALVLFMRLVREEVRRTEHPLPESEPDWQKLVRPLSWDAGHDQRIEGQEPCDDGVPGCTVDHRWHAAFREGFKRGYQTGRVKSGPWKGVGADGSVGFDCEHEDRRALVTFAADGDVEIVLSTRRTSERKDQP
jgi:hypothetical protein